MSTTSAPAAPDPDPEPRLTTMPSQDPLTLPSITCVFEAVNFDEKFIDDTVTSRVRNGVDRVGRNYRATWNRAREATLEQLESQARSLRHQIDYLRDESKRARRDYQKHTKWSPLVNWTSWALFKFMMALIMMVVIGLSSFAGVFQLLSNTPAFSGDRGICLAVASVVLAMPFGIKLFLDSILTEVWRNRIDKYLGLQTAVLFLVFAVLLALVTGGNGASIPDPSRVVDALQWNLADRLSVHLQYVQLFMELSAALACFSHASKLYREHQSTFGAPHPNAAKELDRSIRAEEAYRHALLELGAVMGLRRALLADRMAYVYNAVNVYLRRASLAKRQEDGILRKQAGDGRPPSSSRFKRFVDFLSDRFNN